MAATSSGTLPPPPIPPLPKVICPSQNLQCLLNSPTKDDPLKKCEVMLQRCGLVALCMAGQLLDIQLNVDQVFTVARDNSYTSQGEMFSALSMCLLAGGLGVKAAVVPMRNQQDQIILHLMNRNPVLVPYDTDGNHAPCNKRGHKAHWAVLTGILIIADCIPFDWKYEADVNATYIQHARTGVQFTKDDVAGMKTNSIYVFAKHGKSRHLALWPLSDLISSNENLCELDPKRKQDGTTYILPPEGVQEGLGGKVLLLSKP